MTKTSNRKPTIHEDVQATLERLEAEDPGLKQLLQKAYGYAVFPSVGKAALVIGGAYGRGEVYEKGKLIGYATIAQTTIGVQIGGDTFSQVIAFESKQSMDRFKKGKFAFAANASAVLVKAGAGGTADYEKGAKAFAYAEGGMLLEAAIGGQRFKFKPLGEEDEKGQGKQGKQQSGKASSGSASRGGGEGGEDEEAGGSEESGLAGRAAGGIREAVAKVAGLVKDHPVAATVIGVGAVGGIALLVTRAVRGSSAGSSADASGSGESEGDEGEARDESDSGSDEDREEQDDAGDDARDEDQDEDQDEGQDDDQDEQGDQDEESDADESDEEDSGEDDADEGEEEEEETPRRGRSRARS